VRWISKFWIYIFSNFQNGGKNTEFDDDFNSVDNVAKSAQKEGCASKTFCTQ